MKKLLLVLAFVAVFALGWGVRSWTAHRGMCGRGHGDHAMMCGKHGGGHVDHHGRMAGCGKSGVGCCKKMDNLDCCEKTDCVKSGKLDSTEITVGHGDRDGDKECCKKMDDDKKK